MKKKVDTLEVVAKSKFARSEVEGCERDGLSPSPYPSFIEASIDGALVIVCMSQKIHRHPIEQPWCDESVLNLSFPIQYVQLLSPHHSLPWFELPTR